MGLTCAHVTKIPTGDTTWREEPCPAPAFGLYQDEPLCWHHLHAVYAERMRPIDIKPLPVDTEALWDAGASAAVGEPGR